MRRSRLALATLVLAAACGDKDTTIKIKDAGVTVNIPVGDSAQAKRGADDFRIETVSHELVLAVRGDSVRVRIADSAKKAAMADVSKKEADDGALASMIKQQVGNVVAKTMNLEVSIPYSAIKKVVREDSLIRFEMKEGTKVHVNTDKKYKDALGAFTPADADKFVAFVTPKLTP
jgi:hypothetical protein